MPIGPVFKLALSVGTRLSSPFVRPRNRAMGHDVVEFAGSAALFRDSHLNLVRCIMLRVAERDVSTSSFHRSLLEHLRKFEWITVGVFSDFELDHLLQTQTEQLHFLSFLDDCAAFLCEYGPMLRHDFLNGLTEDTDRWSVDVPLEYPLLGLGRFANLVAGVPPAVWYGDPVIWSNDDLSRRMKQEFIIERRTISDEPTDPPESSS